MNLLKPYDKGQNAAAAQLLRELQAAHPHLLAEMDRAFDESMEKLEAMIFNPDEDAAVTAKLVFARQKAMDFFRPSILVAKRIEEISPPIQPKTVLQPED